jgi:stearoyl-CoA desaturase (delta-9 desaturase)
VTRGIKKVFFEGAELYRAESRNRETVEKYGHGTPDDWIERNLYTKYSALGVSLMLVLDLVLFGVLGLTVWAVQMAWIPVTAAGIINGIGHFWGYRNFDSSDASTNIFPLGILIGGEELHNNHHTYGTSAKLSNKWYEFDIGWLYISIMAFLGLAKVKKVPPEPRFDLQKQVCDLTTLQSVVANRYDVMAKYARSLKRTWRDEVVQLKASARLEPEFLKSTKQLLQRAPDTLQLTQKQQLSELFQHSKALKTMHEMRTELAALWERSHQSSDQLVLQLRDWCARAEASGIRSLEEFSHRLRSYA